MSVILNCVARASSGKSASRILRRENLLPCVIYTKNGQNVNVCLYLIEIENLIRDPHFYTKAITLKVFPESCVEQIKKLKSEVNEKSIAEYTVLPRDVQFNVLTDRPTHLDFAIVKKGDRVKVEIPVKFHNADKNAAIKFGGSLLVLSYNIKIMCTVGSIPSQIDIDVINSKSGQILRISDLILPEHCNIIKDRDIVKISGKRGMDTAKDDEVKPVA